MTRGKAEHRWTCPNCGRECRSDAAWHARQRSRCRPCIRVANDWSCLICGTTDPEHPSPCPESTDSEVER